MSDDRLTAGQLRQLAEEFHRQGRQGRMCGWFAIGDMLERMAKESHSSTDKGANKPDATPAGAVVAETSGVTAGETAPTLSPAAEPHGHCGWSEKVGRCLYIECRHVQGPCTGLVAGVDYYVSNPKGETSCGLSLAADTSAHSNQQMTPPSGQSETSAITVGRSKSLSSRSDAPAPSTTGEEGLKPCPFCGSTNVVLHADFRGGHYAKCEECWVYTHRAHADRVKEIWNRRAATPAPTSPAAGVNEKDSP